LQLLGKIAGLERVVGEQRQEFVRLTGLKGRHGIKPSGMNKATEPPKSAQKAPRQDQASGQKSRMVR
jgi:hypothetical protein